MRRFCLGLLTAALTFALGVATAPTPSPRRYRAAVGRMNFVRSDDGGRPGALLTTFQLIC
jgi:hypothetical protein